MLKLLIADDEPLVQVGIKSMLNWAELGIEVCATAMNGKQALDLIGAHSPDIVITDIKMPIMNGLELARESRERYGRLPVFLVLTSYEEFELVRQAIKNQVLDYLIKLELNQDSLREAMKKAITQVLEYKQSHSQQSPSPPPTGYQVLYDKFIMGLLHNLFEDQEQFCLQAKDLKLDFSYDTYIVCHCSIRGLGAGFQEQEKLLGLYVNTLQMVREIAPKYLPCHITSLDLKNFCIIFYYNGKDLLDYRKAVLTALTQTFTMLYNYFSVSVSACVGRPCASPFFIAESYQDARQLQNYTTKEQPVVFYDDLSREAAANTTFNISLFKESLKKSFEEFDTETLFSTITDIMELFSDHPGRSMQAMDAACNILYLALSFLPNGEDTLKAVFADYNDGCRSIYKLTGTSQILSWLTRFRDGLCQVLKNQKINYKTQLVNQVKDYVDSHITEKLSLNETAALFGISPNYLSLLFKRNSETGFTEYVTQRKITKAKAMMADGDLKIYEIADHLGFENAFYFSKVFKKAEGISPREYMQNRDEAH